eukprot:gene13650-3116_t
MCKLKRANGMPIWDLLEDRRLADLVPVAVGNPLDLSHALEFLLAR